jgi:hypothetical protein
MLSLLLLVISCDVEENPKDSGTPDTDTVVDDTQGVEAVDADEDGFTTETDCDDADATINPGVVESCDGIDNDCDGLVDDADDPVSGRATWYQDLDGDGYGNAGVSRDACEAPTGYVDDPTDCDDLSTLFHPGAEETDCTDERDLNCDGSIGYADADEDGFAACEDCDDANNTAHPGAVEICDGVDNNCDGSTDESDAVDASTWYNDTDNDGYGDPDDSAEACDAPYGYVDDATDCDDTNGLVNEGATETCDGADNDCDGWVDDTDPDVTGTTTWYGDSDGDGIGGQQFQQDACTAPAGFVSTNTDCDDLDATSFPGASEVCDEADNDCDGTVDEGVGSLWYQDNDGDGYGNGSLSQESCEAPTGYVANALDCDDFSATTSPASYEVCDGTDNDCDGTVDEDAINASTFYGDADGDGYGTAAVTTTACSEPSNYAATGGDCDDGNSAVSPGAAEGCDGIDNDCDGAVDEADSFNASTWYADGDGDGYGDAASPIQSCTAPSGYVADATDCNDADGASTSFTVDADCDGTLTADDCDDSDAASNTVATDGDCDGALTADDCDDADPSAYPGNQEVCDGIDNDCDQDIDEALSGTAASCAAIDCNDILSSGNSSGDGTYWIDPNSDGVDPMEVYCDMSTDGGGWTLIMTTSSSSAYTYSHAVWTDSSGGSTAAANPSAQQDYVSAAFYEISSTESRLALGSTANWNSWYHTQDTARNLANQSRMSGSYGAAGNCSARTNCGTEPINLIPLGVEGGCSDTSSGKWHRFGYINDVNSWGSQTRVGFSGDNDGSDSSDTVMGLGLSCTNACLSSATTGSPHNQGSGYYFYSGWATSPYDDAVAGWLWIR